MPRHIKQQAVIVVSVTVPIFLLLLESSRLFRYLCIVVLLSWLTGAAFDLKDNLDAAWESVPGWVKRFLPGNRGGRDTNGHDRADWTLEGVMAISVVRLRELGVTIGVAVARLRREVRGILIVWLQTLIDHLTTQQESQNQSASHPLQTVTQSDSKHNGWYALLVKTPPVHDYGSFASNPSVQAPPAFVPWGSYDTSSIPPMVNPLNFQIHVSFGLVEKDVWDSRRTKLFEKLAEGLYWDIRGEHDENAGIPWRDEDVRKISAVEILGFVDGAHNAVQDCHRYFASLRQGWKYMKISWNDVDFAIILGQLVTGLQAAEKSKLLFDTFWSLRVKQALIPRSQVGGKGFIRCWCVAAVSGIVTIGTGGLAIPVTGPLFMGSCATGLGFGVAGVVIDSRDTAMWKRRTASCRELLAQFPQLASVLST